MLVFLLLLFYSTSVCNNKDDDEIRGLVKHLCCSVLSSYCFIFYFINFNLQPVLQNQVSQERTL